jgi:hypothetical protein
MPQWIDTPAGPQYVDEYGNPAVPPDAVLVPGEVDAAAAVPDFAPPVPSRQMAVDPSVAPAAVQPVAQQPSGAAGPLPGTSNGQSVSASQSAFSLPSFQAVNSTIGEVRQAQQVAKRDAEAGRQAESQWTAAIGGDQARAATNLGNAEADMQSARGAMYGQQAELQSQMATAEVAAANDAALRTSGYRARFEQQLSQASALRVDPRLNFNRTDSLSAVGLLFTQGFLAAQGVPVFDANGMINKLIDRKVDQDMLAIQQGHKLAEGTRLMWDMARSEAADEAEARGRFRALTMAQAASEMEAVTSQFGSRVATAKGQAAAADIRVQINKDLASITDRYFARYMQQSKLALDEWQTKVSASNAASHLALAKRDMAMKEAAAGKGPDTLKPGVIVDTTDSGGGKPVAKFRDWVPDKVKGELGVKAAATSSLVDRMREYQAIAEEAGTVYAGNWGKALANGAFKQRVINFRNGLGEDMIKATTGAVAPEAQMQRILGQIPLDGILSRDGDKFLDLALGDLKSNVIDKVQRELQAFTKPLTAEEAAQAGSGTPLNMWGGAEALEANIDREGRGERKTRVQELQETITAPPASLEPVAPTDLWKQVGNPTTTGNTGAQQLRNAQTIPGWAPAMEEIFKTAVHTKPGVWGSSSETLAQKSQEARSVLRTLSFQATDPAQRDYALDLLSLIDDVTAADGAQPAPVDLSSLAE